MQVNTQNIQRPALFADFFGLDLMWNNEYLTYIQTFVESVTSNLCNTAKTSINNIKKTLNDDFFSVENVLNRIQNIENQSFEDFKNKYQSIIYHEQDRRLGRL